MLGIFQLIWWLCAVAVGTIEGPYVGFIDNGYIASWIGFISSMLLFNNVFAGTPWIYIATRGENAGRSYDSKLYLLGLFVSSAVVFIMWTQRHPNRSPSPTEPTAAIAAPPPAHHPPPSLP